MKEEDFFAPRPKLSREARLFRASAFWAATGISLIFCLVYWLILISPQMLNIGSFWINSSGSSAYANKLLSIFVVTLFHLALLLPCWRAWLLHRWACYYVFVSWLALSVFGLGGWLATDYYSRAAFLFLMVPLTFAFLQFFLLMGEGHRLKAGF